MTYYVWERRTFSELAFKLNLFLLIILKNSGEIIMLAKATICNQTIQRNDMVIICIHMILRVVLFMSDFIEVE